MRSLRVAPTVTTTYTNDEIFTKLYENILVGVNTAFEKNREHEMEKLRLMPGSLERLTQGTQDVNGFSNYHV